jgi:hypothetical protein
MKMSKIAIAGMVVAQAGAGTNDNSMALENLEPLRWHYRVLLLRSEDPAEEMRALLAGRKKAIDERDILWFLVEPSNPETNYPGPLSKDFINTISSEYFSGSSPREVVLLGKDGGIKARADTLSLDSLFHLIDSMPMRQAELRRRAD